MSNELVQLMKEDKKKYEEEQLKEKEHIISELKKIISPNLIEKCIDEIYLFNLYLDDNEEIESELYLYPMNINEFCTRQRT